MHTIGDLRGELGLSTAHQVRNRINAIRDVLGPHLRRGPNNQLLVDDEGVELLRGLQQLSDTGLTLSEASSITRAKNYKKDTAADAVLYETERSAGKAGRDEAVLQRLCEEVRLLRERLAWLERGGRRAGEGTASRWWDGLREEIDGA